MSAISDVKDVRSVSAHPRLRELAPPVRCLSLVNEVNMFNQTFVGVAQTNKKPVMIALSLALQGIMICLLILTRLVYTESLPGAVLKSLLLAPVPPQAAVPEPLPKVQPRSMARIFDGRKLFAPVTPKQLLSPVQTTPAPEIGVTGDVVGANGLALTGVVGSISSPLPEAPVPTSVERMNKPSSRKPVLFGSILAEANLIHRVMPVYPLLARSARVQGPVEFTALISKEGRIENLQLVRGHPLLVDAARRAVAQWRYRPTLLNGEPVEVITDIIVNFTLAQ